MDTKGVVVSQKGQYYLIALRDPSSGCKDCALAAICKAPRSSTIMAKSEYNLKVGQEVEIKYSELSLMAIYAVIFLFPVIVLIAVLSLFKSPLWAFIATIVSFLILKLLDKWLAEHIAKPIAVPLNYP